MLVEQPGLAQVARVHGLNSIGPPPPPLLLLLPYDSRPFKVVIYKRNCAIWPIDQHCLDNGLTKRYKIASLVEIVGFTIHLIPVFCYPVVALFYYFLAEFLLSSAIIRYCNQWLSFAVLSHSYLIHFLMILIVKCSLIKNLSVDPYFLTRFIVRGCLLMASCLWMSIIPHGISCERLPILTVILSITSWGFSWRLTSLWELRSPISLFL